MELIKRWLAGTKNFHVGVVLYNRLGQDERLKKLLQGKPDNYLQKRLEQALMDLLNKPAETLRPVPSRKDADEMPDSKDPVLQAIRAEWLPLYQRMNYLRHELDRVTTTIEFPLYDLKHEPGNSAEEIAKRGPIAFEILELEQQCMKIWSRRDHYLQQGKLPEVKEKPPVEIPKDPIELAKLIDSTKRNIRRNKQLAEQHPGKPGYPLKVKQYEEQLEYILKQTGNGGATE